MNTFRKGEIYRTKSGAMYYVHSRESRKYFDYLFIQPVDEEGHLQGKKKDVFIKTIKVDGEPVEYANLDCNTNTYLEFHSIRADYRLETLYLKEE